MLWLAWHSIARCEVLWYPSLIKINHMDRHMLSRYLIFHLPYLLQRGKRKADEVLEIICPNHSYFFFLLMLFEWHLFSFVLFSFLIWLRFTSDTYLFFLLSYTCVCVCVCVCVWERVCVSTYFLWLMTRVLAVKFSGKGRADRQGQRTARLEVGGENNDYYYYYWW